jgi:hypothetical protein
MTYLRTLRLFFGDGVSIDYRMNDHFVEFQPNGGRWRILSDSDIELHYRLNTEVAQWLRSNHMGADPHMRSVG